MIEELDNKQLLILKQAMNSDYSIVHTAVRRQDVVNKNRPTVKQKKPGIISGIKSGIKNIFGFLASTVVYSVSSVMNELFGKMLRDPNVANVKSEVMWKVLMNLGKLNKKGNMSDIWNEVIIYIQDAIQQEKKSPVYQNNPNKQYLIRLEELIDAFDKKNQQTVSTNVDAGISQPSANQPNVGADASQPVINEDFKNKVDEYIYWFNRANEYDLSDYDTDGKSATNIFDNYYDIIKLIKLKMDSGQITNIDSDAIDWFDMIVDWFKQNENSLYKKSDISNLIDIVIVEKELRDIESIITDIASIEKFGVDIFSEIENMEREVIKEILEAKGDNKTKILNTNFNKLKTYVEQLQSKLSQQTKIPDNVIPVDFEQETTDEYQNEIQQVDNTGQTAGDIA